MPPAFLYYPFLAASHRFKGFTSGVRIGTMAAIGILSCIPHASGAVTPLRIHPQNPYIFEFRGEPVILRAFGEHYGSVINPDFDYNRYLDVIQRDGLNLTRVVLLGFRSHSLPTMEPLAPAAAGFMQPWARVAGHGNALDGQPKWDLSVWNESYFTRLRNFAKACSDRGIVVEMSLFNVIYDQYPDYWNNSPFNPSNNVQGHGPASQFDAVRVVDANLFAAQEAAVRRIVRELNPFDNIYYEIENEPFWNQPDYKDAEEAVFHNSILAIIRNEESGLPNRHLVAHNFPDQLAALSSDFDVINCHYPYNVLRGSMSPIIGGENLLAGEYTRGKPLSLDESSATDALFARLEAWMFVLGGGGIYNGLDSGVFNLSPSTIVYSTQNEAGDVEPAISIRKHLRDLGTYTAGLHLPSLRRNQSWITGGIPSGARVQAMASPGQQYVAYLHHGTVPTAPYSTVYYPISTSNHTASLQVSLAAGTWRVVWTKPDDLSTIGTETFSHAGGTRTLQSVLYQADVALRIDRTGAADTTPPPTPGQPAAGRPDNGAIALSWSPVQAADIASYRVYHSVNPGVAVTIGNRVADIPAAQNSFLHGSLAMNSPHHYVVTSVDLNGNESPASREVRSMVASQPFGGTPWPVPGTIQCEDFDTGGQGIAFNDLTSGNSSGTYRPAEDVDIGTTTDSGGGHHVNGVATSEWLNYTLQVIKTDTFTLSLRCLAPTAGSQIQVHVDGIAAGSITIPASAAWQTIGVPDIAMTEGTHTLRLTFTAAGGPGDSPSLNWISLAPKPRTGPNAHAGPDLTVTDSDWNLVESVTPSASSSTAGTHTITSYSWMENGQVIASGINPTLQLASGQHLIQLITTDSAGLTDTDDMRITVASPGFVNGGFENDAVGWTTIGNALISTAHAATQGAKTLVFNSSESPPNGVMLQSFATVPGQSYRLRFDMGVTAFNSLEQRMQLDVTGDGPLLSKTYSAFGTGGGTLAWSGKSETFTANSKITLLTFTDRSTATNSIDLLLDNVRVTRVLDNRILPDPASIVMLPSSRKVRITSPDTGSYRFQRSADLHNWSTLEQREIGTPGLIEFTDSTAAGTRVFYRICLDQTP